MNTQKNLVSKIALLSLLFFFIGMTTTFAQSERGKQMRNKNATPEEKAEKRSQKWKTEFTLTDTQTSQVKTALIKRITATEALRGQEKGEDKKTERQSIMTEFDSTIKGILTADQYAAYEKKKEEKKNKMKENRGKGKKGNRGQGHDSDDDDF